MSQTTALPSILLLLLGASMVSRAYRAGPDLPYQHRITLLASGSLFALASIGLALAATPLAG